MSKVKAAWLWDVGPPSPELSRSMAVTRLCALCVPGGHQPPLGDKTGSSPKGLFPSPDFTFPRVPGEGLTQSQGNQQDTHPRALHRAGHTFQLMPPTTAPTP